MSENITNLVQAVLAEDAVVLPRTTRGQKHQVDIAVGAFHAADEYTRRMWARFPVRADGTVVITESEQADLLDLADDMDWSVDMIERVRRHSTFVTARTHAATALTEGLTTVR